MRNPNRLVGTLMAVVVVVGLTWWVASERRTASDAASSPSLSQPNSPVVTPQPPTPAAVPAMPAQASVPAKPQDPVSAFKDWASRYAAANDAAAKASLLGEGIGLAEQRRKVMEATIRANPAQAIRDALPFSVRQAMPETILGLLEKVVAGNGDLDVLGAVGAKGGSKPAQPIQRWVNLNGERYKAFVYGARRLDNTRRGEPLWGVALGGLIAVSEDPGRLLAEDEAAALLAGGKQLDDPICGVSGVASQPGVTPRVMELGSRLQGICSAAHASALNSEFRKARQTRLLPSDPGGSNPTNGPAARTISVTQGRFNVLFMLVSFDDDPREPITRDELSRMMNDVNDYYRTASYNLVQMHTTITPVLRLRRSVLHYSIAGGAGPIGLLADARAAAAEAGYDIEDYDLDVLGHAFLGGSEFDYGGLGFVGARGSWIQSFTPKVIVHELGHNLGLWHANASDTTRPPYDPPTTIPPTPINAASYFGHFGVPRHSRHVDPISDLTFDVEYGDPNDWMGNGDSLQQQFNSLHKVRLKWLPPANIAEAAEGVSRHRIYAFDATDALPDRQYSLYVEKEPNREPESRAYWIDHRALTAGNPYLQNGVLLYWTPWDGTAGTAQLLDMTPGSQGGVDDSALALGRTFSDEQSGIDITPVARGGQGREIWYDIVVNRGRNINNRAPNFVLGISSDFVEVGETVVCAAENVLDPDGDEVSVYWHFSDETQPSNEPAVSRSFSSPGHYVVRCEVSDMKGGKRSQHRVITVGAPSTVVLQGVVRDENGAPLSDAIVAVVGANQLVTLSDSEGRYSLAGANNSLVTNVAYKHGFETSPANFDNPAPVINGDGPSMDHVAVALPLISVQAVGTTMDEGRGALGSFFRFNRRGGGISNPVVAYYSLVGSASNGGDYRWEGTPGTVVFQPGITNVDVPMTVLDDRDSEGMEFVTVQLLLATNIERYINYVTNIVETNVIMGVTNVYTNNYLVVFTNSVPVPGWELRTINGVETWFQSYYPYAIGNELASLSIADNDSPVPSTIDSVLFDETAVENGQDDASVLLLRTGSLDQPIAVNISVSGTASNGLDYIVVESPVRFASGQSAAMVVIRAKDDLLIEGDELVTVRVEPGANYTASADPQTVIIVDDDLPMVTVTADVSEAQESQFGFPLSFTISRAGNLNVPLAVNYLAGGTASNGVDYPLLTGVAVIPAGQDSVTVTVRALVDVLKEAPETVEIRLTPTTYYNVGRLGSAMGTIYDDSFPQVDLRVTGGARVDEPSSGTTLTVSRRGPLERPLTVNLAFGGTADRFSDYSVIGNQITIPAGAATVSFTINVIDDAFSEGEENIIVQLLPGSDYWRATPAQGSLVINPSDGGNLPLVQFVLPGSVTPESAGTELLMVRLSRVVPTNRLPIVVEYRVVGGTATPETDWTLPDSPSASRGFFVLTNPLPDDPELVYYLPLPVAINDDAEAEPTESFTIGLFHASTFVFSNLVEFTNFVEVTDASGVRTVATVIQITNYIVAPTNYALGPVRFHTFAITDNDNAIVSIEADVPFAQEAGQVSGGFVFKRTGNLNKALTVGFGVTGDASPDTDYAGVGNSITFPAGVDSVRLPIQPIDDETPEVSENVHISLSRVPGGSVDEAKHHAEVRIVDDDGAIQFGAAEFVVSEATGVFNVPVQRYGRTNILQSVNYRAVPGSATPGLDYSMQATGTLVFQPGEILKTISITISNDVVVEPDETILLSLQELSGGLTLSGQQNTTVIINSDDSGFRFVSSSLGGAERTNNHPILIQRLGPLQGPASVTLSVSAGTAQAGTDFVPTNRVFNFTATATNQSYNLRVLDDFVVESNETIILQLTNASAGFILGAEASAVFTIEEDDCRIEFVRETYRVNEFETVARIQLQRIGGVVNSVAADWRTTAGTALAGVDFLSGSGTVGFAGNTNRLATDGSGQLVFEPGQTNAVIEVAILDDTLGEGNEQFTVTLSNPRVPGAVFINPSVRLGAQTQAPVNIFDDERPGSVVFGSVSGFTIDGAVNALTAQPDGRVVFGGDFLEVNGLSLRRVARLTPAGSLDTGFNPGLGAEGSILALASQADGKVILGGTFTQVRGVIRSGLARLEQDGDLDAQFDATSFADGAVRAIAVQPDGRILIGGDFLNIGTLPRLRLARLLPNGALDVGFSVALSGPVHAIAVQADGRIVVGGDFLDAGGTQSRGIVRLLSNGARDTSFVVGQGFQGGVRALGIHSDGTLVVGGFFSSYQGQPARNLAFLSTDGALIAGETTLSSPNDAVLSIQVDSANRTVLGGRFTSLGTAPRNRYARLLPSGDVDAGFDVGEAADAPVRAVLVHSGSKIDLGGEFNTLNGIPRNRLGRIQGDERSAGVGVVFSASDYSIGEGAGDAIITLRRAGASEIPFEVTLDVGAAGSTATLGQDYVGGVVTLNFAPGINTVTHSVRIIEDSLDEGNEVVQLRITGASPGVDLSGLTRSRLSILDNEATVEITPATRVVAEADGAVSFTLTRQGLPASVGSLRVSAVSGSAESGADFANFSQRVTFAPGQNSIEISIPLINDPFRESAEQFTVVLGELEGNLRLGRALAAVTITDDDFERIEFAAIALVSDQNGNLVVEPGEQATVMIALHNSGTADTTNVTAELLAENGVVSPSAAQNYGTLKGGGSPASRPFTFSNSAQSGNSIVLLLRIRDGGTELGVVQVPIPIGPQSRSFAATTRIQIPELGVANPYPSIIDVRGFAGLANKVVMTLQGLTHPAPDHLDMLLVGPNGDKSVVFSDVGGKQAVNNINITLDDAAPAELNLTNRLFTGLFRPRNAELTDVFRSPAPDAPYRSGSLNFGAIDPNGPWSLYVQDDTPTLAGELSNGWQITVSGLGRFPTATDVGVEIVAQDGVGSVNQPLTFVIVASNNGPAPATGVQVLVTLPSDVEFVSASQGQFPSEGILRFTAGALAVGETRQFEAVVRPFVADVQLTAEAVVTSTTVDILANNNRSEVRVDVELDARPFSVEVSLQGANVRLAWPSRVEGAVLESSSNANGPWQAVSASVQSAEGSSFVLLPAEGVARFYRVRKP